MADALVECVVSKNNTHTITFNEGLIWHIYATGSLVATVLENKVIKGQRCIHERNVYSKFKVFYATKCLW